jgi:steroid delta-isomerase-like uncharacterized protein
MSTETNKSIVRRYLERAWGHGDEAAACDLISEDYRDHHPPPGVPEDRAGLIYVLRIFNKAFPDAEIRVDQLIAEGDTVADRWTLHATHRNDFFGVPSTGRRITLTGMDMHRLVDGQIVETWHQEDILGLLRQLEGDSPRDQPL